MPLVLRATQIALIAILATAVVGKLRGRAAWLAFVASLTPFAGTASRRARLALGVVIAEAGAAVLLAVAPALGAVTAASVFAVLAGGAALVVARGLIVRCNCFGRAGAPLGWFHVGRNLALASAALAVALAVRAAPLAGSIEILTPAAVAGALAAIAIVRSEDLVAVFVRPPVSPSKR